MEVNDAAETVIDAVETVADTVENLPESVDPRIRAAVLVTGGILIGASTTYLIVRNRLRKKYEALAEEEIASVQAAYARAPKPQPYKSPDDAVIALGRAKVDKMIEGDLNEYEEKVDELGYTGSHRDDQTVPPGVVVNIFNQAKDDPELDADGVPWDHGIDRNGDRPYPLRYEEFVSEEGESGNFDKVTVTYFEGDEVLMDEREEIIPEIDDFLGLENLNYFGRSNPDDPDTVYIRNPVIRTDFEVCRDTGKYSVIILGENEDARDD